ncbi:MAG: intermembrane transport protein PqiB [Janthinobacterium lividum]
MSGQEDKPGNTAASDTDGGDAVIHKRRLSWIWLIPLASVLIGGGLLWTTLARRGPMIQITFDSAEGLQAGQSQVKYKDIQMGTVESFDLTPDRKRVVMSVRMTAKAEELVTEGAQFWIAKPRVYAGDITGLNTILSGSYVAMQPGEVGHSAQRSFDGLAEPPTLIDNVAGRQISLTTSRLGAVKLGTPVFFHDLEVGRVVGWDLAGMAESVMLHVFINAPYAGWVHRDSRFWNSSGVRLRLGPEGVQLQVESLKAAVLGGITFDTPVHGGDADAPQAAASANGDSFLLYPSEEVAQTATAPDRAMLASYFTGSVGGLGVGAHVTLQGLPVGDVTSVDLQYLTETDQTRVRVGFMVQPSRVAPVGSKPPHPFPEYWRQLVKEGLRTRLKGGNLLTGQKEVAMQLEPDAPPAELEQEGDVPVIPTDDSGSGGLDDLAATANQLMAKIGAMPFAEIGQNLNGALHGASEVTNSPQLRQALVRLNGTLAAVQDTVRHLDAEGAPALRRLPAIAADLQGTLAQVRTLAASVSAGSSGDAKFGRDLDRALMQVTDAASSVRMVADLLSRHPEALVRGRVGRATE